MWVGDLAPSRHATEGLVSHHSHPAVRKTARHCLHSQVLPKLPWEFPPSSISRGLDKTQRPVHLVGQRNENGMDAVKLITNAFLGF